MSKNCLELELEVERLNIFYLGESFCFVLAVEYIGVILFFLNLFFVNSRILITFFFLNRVTVYIKSYCSVILAAWSTSYSLQLYIGSPIHHFSVLSHYPLGIYFTKFSFDIIEFFFPY